MKHSKTNQKNATSYARLKVGEGYISGYLSIFFALVSFGGVLCFLFPEILTTPEYRHNYPVEILRGVLLMCILFSFLFALVSLILCKSKIPSLLATVISGLSILMGGATVEIKQFNDLGFYVSLDWLLLDLLVLALIFIPVELFFPKRTNQSKFHEEWKTDLIYFAFGHLLVQITAVSVQAPASYFFGSLHLEGLHQFIQTLPLFLELPLALLVTDLFQYTAHRTFHRMPFLWRFHAVHHSIRSVDWMAGSRLHIIDVLLTRAFSYLPLYVLGFSLEVFYLYVIIVSLQAVLAHANTRMQFGFLKYLIVTPQYHHWHHSDNPSAYDKNFAIHFPFIDFLFGTYHLPGDQWPESTGLADTSFPKGYFRQFAFPFWKNPSDQQDMKDPSQR
jgi:sterol desaturase/sphingolipid hydroxylase (fatty acid hydroxylase superfamily)